jgi:predicted enzyme related to lactoylglutathione lyase
MKLAGICLETKSLTVLNEFYEMLFSEESQGDERHRSFEKQQLALFQPDELISQSSFPNSILMFEVIDLDDLHEKIKNSYIKILEEPTLKPWGVKTLSILDPDGNRVNLLQPLNDNK